MAVEAQDTGLVAARAQLERARSLASDGDFAAAAEAYARVEGQLRKLAAAAPEPSLQASWAEFLSSLRHEQELVAAWRDECADLSSWAAAVCAEQHTPVSAASGRRGAPAAFAVDPRSFELEELPAPHRAVHTQQQPLHFAASAGGGRPSSLSAWGGTPLADPDPDVWAPPDSYIPALGAPFSRERTRREREEAYERQRRDSLTPASANSKRAFSGVKPRVNTGAKRASAPTPPDPMQDWDLYSAGDQDLIQQLSRDVLERVPGVKFDEIAGLEEAKQVLREHLTASLCYNDLFEKIPLLRPLKGVLLFGPPGTGKTMLAKAVAAAGAAGEQRTNFINVSASTLASKYRGESEKLVRFLFEIARAHQPCVIFIDEIDSLCSCRGSQNEHEASRRMKTELLTQIDGMQSSGGGGQPRVMVLAATNYPWDIDEALRRRLEKRIYIPLPTLPDRAAMLALCLRGMAAAPDVDLKEIARRTEGFSGDDIANLVRSAADNVIRRVQAGRAPESMSAAELEAHRREIHAALTSPGITGRDFAEALRRSNPSCSASDVERHVTFAKQYGCR